MLVKSVPGGSSLKIYCLSSDGIIFNISWKNSETQHKYTVSQPIIFGNIFLFPHNNIQREINHSDMLQFDVNMGATVCNTVTQLNENSK